MTARPQESTQALGLVELDKSFDHEQEIRGVPAILSAPNLCQVCPILVGDAYHERLGFKGEQGVCKLELNLVIRSRLVGANMILSSDGRLHGKNLKLVHLL